jgi:DNA gyrase subunit A
LIGLDDGAKLSGLQRIVENDAIVPEETGENSASTEGDAEESGSTE